MYLLFLLSFDIYIFLLLFIHFYLDFLFSSFHRRQSRATVVRTPTAVGCTRRCRGASPSIVYSEQRQTTPTHRRRNSNTTATKNTNNITADSGSSSITRVCVCVPDAAAVAVAVVRTFFSCYVCVRFDFDSFFQPFAAVDRAPPSVGHRPRSVSPVGVIARKPSFAAIECRSRLPVLTRNGNQ